jgi:hypothetical protein
MSKIKKSLQIDYKKDELYIQVSKMIGYDKPTVSGSYIKYGKDKSCDMDISEDILDFNTSLETRKKFIDYIKNIYNNKKKYNYVIYQINIKLKNNYDKIQKIYDLLSPINGLLEIDNNMNLSEIKKLIDDLPFELKMEISELFNLYIKNKNLETYIAFMYGLYKRLYSQWTMKELLKGKKEYYDESYDILDMSQEYSHFYIEIIYNNFRISNYIMFSDKDIHTNEDILKISIQNILNDDNKISYYYLLKKIGYFMKWLFFNKKLDKKDIDTNVKLYNKLFDFRNDIGLENNNYCIMKNKIDLYKIKLNKYNKKSKSSKKYDKYINKYEKRIYNITKEYNKGTSKIDKKCYDYYNDLLKNYKQYFEKYIAIK